MGPRRDADWMRTLDEVDRAVRGCLETLDRYEEKFAHLLQGTGVPTDGRVEGERPAAGPGPARDELAESLTATTETADPIETLLAEQQAAWEQWQRAFAEWRQSLEQRLGPATPPTA